MTSHLPPDEDNLRQRWLVLAQRLHFPAFATPIYHTLHALYTEPHRHYHNLLHIRECLDLLHDSRACPHDTAAVELAIWFHDAIYDPQCADNEQQSADLASDTLSALNASTATINDIQRLILATRHTAAPTEPDEKLIVDIDLAILGQPWPRFSDYEHAIRREYAHVPDEAFRAGRSSILKRFLDRRSIYTTESFQVRFESRARQNLTRSLSLQAL